LAVRYSRWFHTFNCIEVKIDKKPSAFVLATYITTWKLACYYCRSFEVYRVADTESDVSAPISGRG
jgi:hypothetical protein